jgi:Zn-dependent M28 family amino/carboxypeptidase
MKKPRLIRLAAIAAIFIVGTVYYQVTSSFEQARIATPLPSAGVPVAATPQFDQAVLLADLHTLAAPAMEGRKTGSEGNRKAQAYLQERFAALNLKPFGTGYAHTFSFTHTSIKGLVTPGRPYKTEYPAATNLIGFIPGTQDPNRFLVISAHYDHLGVRNGRLYPGADDNASGVAAMLAIAAYLKQHPPLHSVVFAAFDGEELGLRGAKAFMHALPFPKAQLAANLNLDMVGRNNFNRIFAAGTSYTPSLKPLVEQVAMRSSVKVILGHDRSQLVAGNVEDWTDSSDHGPFHDAGIPFLYFGVEDHEDYHAPTDTVGGIKPDFYIRVTTLLVDMAATLDRQLGTVKAQ